MSKDNILKKFYAQFCQDMTEEQITNVWEFIYDFWDEDKTKLGVEIFYCMLFEGEYGRFMNYNEVTQAQKELNSIGIYRFGF